MSRPAALTGFEGQDIRTLIDANAARGGDRPFLIWEPFEGEGARWSHARFADAVRRFAAGLLARDVSAGDRVIIHLENRPEFVIAWLGCAYAGAVPVTTNVGSTVDELGYFARHSGAMGAVTEMKFARSLAMAAPGLDWRALTGELGGPAELPAGFEAFAAIDGDPATLAPRPPEPRAPFGIQYTSGTTARPKAVLWTHANALWGARLCALHEDLRSDDVHLVFLPLFHTNAQVYSVLASLWVGATVVLQPRFSASRFWQVSLKHRATWSSMVPFCARALLGQPVPERHDYRFWGNAVCAPAWDARFGVKTIGWWGMTETIAHGIVGDAHHPDASMSTGRPSPGYSVHVLREDGSQVEPGEVGDLLIGGVRGVSLFQEYIGDPEATAAAFRDDGLFKTGDRVRLGEDGFVHFADRSKDMLKVGGENVAASEIERVIASVSGVAEVAVIGRPDPMLDEVPVAFVLAASDAETDLPARIDAACASALAAFKRPHEIRIVDALPRSTLEKVAKAELRDMLTRPPSAAQSNIPIPERIGL